MKFVLGMFAGITLAVLAVVVVGWSGLINFGAAQPANEMEEKLAEYFLENSIKKHAPESMTPLPTDAASLAAGLEEYRESCLPCHGAPDLDRAEFANGLNPSAPELSDPELQSEWSDAELYWIVANGIRATGMPAFSVVDEEKELREIVAFVRHLPKLTEAEKAALAGGEEAGAESAAPAPANVGAQ